MYFDCLLALLILGRVAIGGTLLDEADCASEALSLALVVAVIVGGGGGIDSEVVLLRFAVPLVVDDALDEVLDKIS